jgi:Cytochrome P460
MKRMSILALAAVTAAGVTASVPFTAGRADDESSPIFGVKIPAGYRQWKLVAVAHESELDELRGVLGNTIAMKAYQDGTLPYPDGTILAKLAWKHVPLAEIHGAFVTGSATTVQIMIKDSKKIRSDRWLGLWPVHRRQARRRGAAQNLLRLSRGQRERSRLRLYPVSTVRLQSNLSAAA